MAEDNRRTTHFNPRSSYEERPPVIVPHTRSVYFNPRSSYEERLHLYALAIFSSQFQSTLLIRGATDSPQPALIAAIFQSTLLIRGATCRDIYMIIVEFLISIHAPHTRSDDVLQNALAIERDFNPRSSYEERLMTSNKA